MIEVGNWSIKANKVIGVSTVSYTRCLGEIDHYGCEILCINGHKILVESADKIKLTRQRDFLITMINEHFKRI